MDNRYEVHELIKMLHPLKKAGARPSRFFLHDFSCSAELQDFNTETSKVWILLTINECLQFLGPLNYSR